MQDKERCCGTCVYTERYDGEFICFNEDSKAYALETEYGDYCEEYLEKEDN